MSHAGLKTEDSVSAPMFPSLSAAGTPHQAPAGTPLTPQGIMLIIRRICARAGLQDSALSTLRPHDLRRSFAQMSREGGADMDMIRHSMGHASLTTTERYLKGIQNLKLGATAPDHIRVRARTKQKQAVAK